MTIQSRACKPAQFDLKMHMLKIPEDFAVVDSSTASQTIALEFHKILKMMMKAGELKAKFLQVTRQRIMLIVQGSYCAFT